MKRFLFLLGLLFCAAGSYDVNGQYCTTGLYSTGCSSGDDISAVSIGTYSNTSGCGAGGYTDNTATPIELTISSTPYPISVSTTYTSASEDVGIWVDWNDDQDFDDPGEFIGATSSPIGGTNPTWNTSIMIDNSRPLGVHRMRIRLNWSAVPAANESCTSYTWGETEDYSIEVKPNILGNCNFYSNFTVDSITGTAAKVDWTPGSANNSYYFEYGPTGFTPGTGTSITGGYPGSEPPLILTGLSPQTTYDYYFGELCNSGSDSAYFQSVKDFTTTKLCASPTGFAAANTTSNSIDLSWSQAGSVQEYWIFYGNVGYNPATSGMIDTVTSTSYTLAGLTPASSYDIYIATNCAGGNGISDTIGPVNINTLIVGPQGVTCASNPGPVTIFSEEFDVQGSWTGDIGTGATNGEWNFSNSGSVNTGPDNAHSGSNYVYFEASGAGPASLISPAIDLTPAMEGAELAFWMHAYGDDVGYLTISVSTASATGPFNDTVFDYQTGQLQASGSDPWQQVGINLDAYLGQTIWLSFESDRANSDFHGDIALDLLTVQTCGDICVDPSGLSASNITGNAADLSWTENGTATQWDIEYGPTGFTPTGTPTNAGVTSNPYGLSGLTPNTIYDFYVRAVCGGTAGNSNWIGPFSFHTALQGPQGVSCTSAPGPITLYTEEFDTQGAWTGDVGTGSSNGMWNFGTSGSFGTGPDNAHSGANYVYFEASGAGPASLISPAIDLSMAVDAAELSFWIHAYGANIGYLTVMVSTDSAAGPYNDTIFDYRGDQLQSSGSDSWQNLGVNLDTYVGQTIWLQFEADRDGGLTGDIALDLLTVETCGNICVDPASLGVSNRTETSADLEWTENGFATQWDIEFGPEGFTPTGTPTDAGVTSNPYPVSGLQPATGYEFYVRASCGGSAGNSDWVGPYKFSTLLPGPTGVTCSPASDPTTFILEEEFATQGAWTGQIGTGSTNGMWNYGTSGSSDTGPDTAYSNSNYVYFEASGAGPAYLVSPAINLTYAVDGAELAFWIHAYGDDVGYLTISVSTTSPQGPFADTVFNYTGGQVQASGSEAWQQVGVDLSNFLGQTIWLRFEADRANPDWHGDIALDLLTVEACGTFCLPEVYEVDSIAANFYDATIHVDTSGSNFQVEWGPCGFTQGTGTFAAGSSPINITGLSPNTCYDVYVRRNCGPDGFSGWGGPFRFGTECLSSCIYTADLYDSWGDGWNGAEITFYQNGREVVTIGSDFTTGLDLLDVPVQLCDSSATHVVLSNAGSFSGEIGFDITSPYEFLVGSHTAGSVSTGDTLASFYTECTAPTCPIPLGLTASPAPDSAVLSWSQDTASIGVGNFEVSYGEGITSPGAGTLVQVSDTTYTITGLIEGRNYCYFVREVCSSMDSSFWEGPYCFTTPCATFTAPLFEDLENFRIGFYENMENCWTVVSNNPGTTPSGGFSWEIRNTIQTTSTNTGPDRDNTLAPAMGGKWFHSDNSGGTTGDSTMLISPLVDISGLSNPELEYYFHIYATGTTYLQHMYVDVYDGNTWHNKVHELNSIYHSSSSDPYNDTIIDLAPFSGNGMIMVRFRTKIVGSAGGSGDIAIDDIRISDPVTCPRPSSLLASDIGMDSAVVSWTSGGASNWQLEYGPAGFARGTGTFVNNATNPYTITGLNSATSYDVYVRDSCGPGDVSFWRGPLKLSTLICETEESCTYTADLFDSWGDGWNGAEIAFVQNGITVQTMGSGFTTGTSLTGLDVTLCDSMTTYVILTDAGSFPTEISFDIIKPDLSVAASHAAGSVSTGDTLATFTVGCPIITCPAPTDLTQSNITSTSVDLSWTSGGASDWQIEYGPVGYTPGSGTVVNAGTNPFTLTGLSASTDYDIYVRDSCGVGDVSFWNGPLSITTLCAPESIPYLEEFAGSGIPNCYITYNQSNSTSANTFWKYAGTWPGYGAAGENNAPGSAGGAVGVDGSTPNDSAVTLETPQVDISGATEPYFTFMKFQNNTNGSGNMVLYVDVYDGANWNNSVIVDSANSTNWEPFSVDLSNFTITGPVQFRFVVDKYPGDLGSSSAFHSDILIDDVSVHDSLAAPVCDPVTNLDSTSTGCDSITVSWTSNTGGSIIEYGPTGFIPGQGTFSGIVNANTYTITGLAPGTAYDIWVADTCTGDTSDYTLHTVTSASGPMPDANINLLIDSISGTTHYFAFDASGTTDATSYNWDFGNSTSGNGVLALAEYTAGGSYAVILTASNACGIDTAMFMVNTDIGLIENALGRSLSVYPNPTEADVTVEFDPQGSSEAILRLMDIRGREIIRSEYENLNGRFREELSLHGLAKGIYMIEIRSGDMRAYRRVNLQ